MGCTISNNISGIINSITLYRKAVIYYESLNEADNITVKPCLLMVYTVNGNKTIIPYESTPKTNSFTQAPDTSSCEKSL